MGRVASAYTHPPQSPNLFLFLFLLTTFLSNALSETNNKHRIDSFELQRS